MGKLIERGATIKCLEKKKITQKVASLRIGVSERHIRRLYKRYKEGGAEALIHKNWGKPSSRKLSTEIESQAIDWLKEHGPDFGSTFAQEKLAEYLNIHVSVSTVRTWRIRNGIFRPGRKKSKIYKRRERKQFFGVMLQIDGSPHDWFEGRGERCFLLTVIDDATGCIFAQFAPHETTADLMKLLWKYLKMYGRPHMVYSDQGGAYKVHIGNHEGNKKTQLGRALDELGIELIHANSPQAKGRVERNHETHQDRLIKEMRLRNISTIEVANKYLEEEYIPQFNQRFTVKPAKAKDVHRSIRGFDLNRIFSIQEERVVQNDGIIHFEKSLIQITKNRIYAQSKSKVLIRAHLNGTITLWAGAIQLGFEYIQNRPEQIASDPIQRPTSKASRAWNKGIYMPYKLKYSYANQEQEKERVG